MQFMRTQSRAELIKQIAAEYKISTRQADYYYDQAVKTYETEILGEKPLDLEEARRFVLGNLQKIVVDPLASRNAKRQAVDSFAKWGGIPEITEHRGSMTIEQKISILRQERETKKSGAMDEPEQTE